MLTGHPLEHAAWPAAQGRQPAPQPEPMRARGAPPPPASRAATKTVAFLPGCPSNGGADRRQVQGRRRQGGAAAQGAPPPRPPVVLGHCDRHAAARTKGEACDPQTNRWWYVGMPALAHANAGEGPHAGWVAVKAWPLRPCAGSEKRAQQAQPAAACAGRQTGSFGERRFTQKRRANWGGEGG